VSQEVVRRLRAEGWFAAHPGYLTVLRHLDGGEGIGPPRCLRIGNLASVRDAIEAELEAMLAGHKTPREGLDAAVKRSNALLSEFADLYR
jgi:sn-glycerol 3-phosphate transport system substrate-binding protein